MTYPIEEILGEVFNCKLKKDVYKDVRLVDGEKEFNQPGISCGLVHFADPDDPSKCLGFGGVNTVYVQVTKNHD